MFPKFHKNMSWQERVELKLDWLIQFVVQGKEDLMTTADDVNARLDEIVAKVQKVGEDLAAEIALVGNAGPGGLSAAEVSTLQGRLQSISDSLSQIDSTMPPAA